LIAKFLGARSATMPAGKLGHEPFGGAEDIEMRTTTQWRRWKNYASKESKWGSVCQLSSPQTNQQSTMVVGKRRERKSYGAQRRRSKATLREGNSERSDGQWKYARLWESVRTLDANRILLSSWNIDDSSFHCFASYFLFLKPTFYFCPRLIVAATIAVFIVEAAAGWFLPWTDGNRLSIGNANRN
jgi:hypothetical protein